MTLAKTKVIPLPLADEVLSTGYYALGLVQIFAKHWQQGVLESRFEFCKVKGHGSEDFELIKQQIDRQTEPAVYLFSSFCWTHDVNLEFARYIKERNPNSLTIFGGANIPRRQQPAEEMMRAHPEIDIAVLGEGEVTFATILQSLLKLPEGQHMPSADFSAIRGLACRSADGRIHWTGTREQIRDLNTIPSPYLEDIFDDSAYGHWVVMETNRGCPFGCTYCDWGGATLSKVRKYDFDRLKQELEFVAEKGAQRLFFADANFGSLTRDEDIADVMVSTRIKYGFPKIFTVNYAKNATPRVSRIITKLYEHKIVDKAVISFQTIDAQTLNNVDRGNIKTDSFEELLRTFKKINIPLTSDILIGLPGQTLETLATDLNFLFEYSVVPVVYFTRVLTNAPMADPEYMERFSIKLSDKGNVISTSTFSEAELLRMIQFNITNIVLVQEGFLKYMLYHLQVEHGIQAMGVLIRLMEISENNSERYPWLRQFMQGMVNMQSHQKMHMADFMHPQWKKEKSKPILDNLESFYREFYCFVEDEYSVSVSENEKVSLINLQVALMHKPHRQLPDTKSVPHDVIAYFDQFTRYVNIKETDENFKRLAEFSSSTVVTPKQFIKKFPYNYSRSPARLLPEWPLYVEGLALQPSIDFSEELPVHHKHTMVDRKLESDSPSISTGS